MRKRKKWKKITKALLIIPSIILAVSSSFCQQQLSTGKQIHQTLHKKVNKNYAINYLLYLPEGYSENAEKFPLVLFLHGASEKGTDIKIVKRNWPTIFVEEGKQFPFILVSPQCPKRMNWDNWALIVLLDYKESQYNVDKNCIYLTGLSMGRHATWSLAIQYPERFAAIVPVWGRGYPQDVFVLKETPIWVFHREKDDIVLIEDASKMVKALKDCGREMKSTVYPDAGHDARTETYNNPELYYWFLKFYRDD